MARTYSIKRSLYIMLAGIILTSGLGLLPQINRLLRTTEEDYHNLIDLSGQQRMLSQKIALDVVSFNLKQDPEFLQTLENDITTFKKNYDFIQNFLKTPELQNLYLGNPNSLNRQYQQFITVVEAYQSTPNQASGELIISEAQRILPELNKAVQLHEQYSNDLEKRSRAFNNFLIIVDLLIVLLISIFLIIPAIRKSELQKYKLRRAQEDAQSASHAKSEFLASMSHEIRTPLTGIIGLNELMMDTNLNNLQKEYQQNIDRLSKALLSTVNEILDYSAVSAGRFKIRYGLINIREFFCNIDNMFSYVASRKGLGFKVNVDPQMPLSLVSDSFRLQQILINLINNSLKFTPEGQIQIDIDVLENKDERVLSQFRIKDTGVGIPTEALEKIFTPFEQAKDDVAIKFGGSGLGLSLVKKLVDLLGGKIWIETEEGSGTSVYFTIEFFTLKEAIRKNIISKTPCNKILVSCPDAENKNLISKILTQINVDGIFTNSQAETTEKIGTESFDMVIAFCNEDVDTLKTCIQKAISNNIRCVVIAEDKNLSSRIENHELITFLQQPVSASDIFENILYSQVENKKQVKYSDFKLVNERKLLLVEDNPTNQMVLSAILKKYGFVLEIANNGAEAVDMVRENNYDLVLMDIQMPVMDGHEAAKRIREFDTQLPIIALSAAVLDHDKKKSAEAGMNAHIGKPFIHEEFVEALSKYVSFEGTSLRADKPIRISKENNDSVLNVNHLKETFGFSEVEIVAILNSFKTNYSDVGEKINSDTIWDSDVKAYVHKLKGEVGNLGMTFIYNLANDIETSESEEKRTELKAELLKAMNAILLEVEEFLRSTNNSEKNIIDFDETAAKKILSTTIENLENSVFLDQTEIDTLLVVLKKWISPDELSQLHSAIDDLNYQAALTTLKNIELN